MKKNPAIVVYHLLTAPICLDEATGRAAEAWAQEHLHRCRHNFAGNASDLLCLHPLFSRVVGFACATLQLRNQEFSLQRVRVSVGDERHCLRLAQDAHADTTNYLMFYSPFGWAPKYLVARSSALNADEGLPPAPLLGRLIDLADLLSLGGVVGAPPLHLALAAQGIASFPRPLPPVAIDRLLADGEHGPLCRELVLSLWGISALYVRMHLGPGMTVRPLDLPLDGDLAAGN